MKRKDSNDKEAEIDAIYGKFRRGEIDPETAFEQVIALGGDTDDAAGIFLWAKDRVVIEIPVNHDPRDDNE